MSAEERPPEAPSPRVLAEEGTPEFERLLQEHARRAEQDTSLAAADTEAVHARPLPRRPWYRSPLAWLLGGVGVLLAVVLGVDAVALVSAYTARSPALGAAAALPMAVIAIALLVLAAREWRSYRSLSEASELREAGARLLAAPAFGAAEAHAARITALYPHRPDVQKGLERYAEQVSSAHSDAEALALYSRLVLRRIDEAAYDVITRHSVDTAALTALSPSGTLDALLALWRNLRMIRRIAALYGVRTGVSGNLRLLRHVLGNLAAAGAGDVLADTATEQLGGQLTAALSARLGQGIANGLLTARLGLIAAELCRPLPFLPEDAHDFRRLRTAIVRQIQRRARPDRNAPA